jgi:hypothetical protein
VCIPENNARALLSIHDDTVRATAISHIENVLNRKTPQRGEYTQKLSMGEVNTIIQKAKGCVVISPPALKPEKKYRKRGND